MTVTPVMSLRTTRLSPSAWGHVAYVSAVASTQRKASSVARAAPVRVTSPVYRLQPRAAPLQLAMKVSKKPSGDEAIRKPSSLEPEEVLYEGPPSWSELLLPGLSILTVIGVIPFAAALTRQFWVRYRISSRSIYARAGFMGREETEIVYRDIEEVRYVRRLGGVSADFVIMLKGGAKLELRAVPNFEKTYDFIMRRVSDDARRKSNFQKEKSVN